MFAICKTQTFFNKIRHLLVMRTNDRDTRFLTENVELVCYSGRLYLKNQTIFVFKKMFWTETKLKT